MAQLLPELKPTAKLWRKLLYSRIMNIFEFKNLPSEVDEQSLKLFLFYRGYIVFYKIGDKYLIQPFSYTDRLNWYYIPLNGRVVNPWLPAGHQNWEFKVADECVIYNSTPDIRNCTMHSTVADLIWKTANQLAENDISYYCIQRNHRLIAIFTAENDIQRAEANRILDRIYSGKSDIVMSDDLVSHIKVNPIAANSTRSSITELIEFQQYVLANFYHSFGINSNYNLKREQLNSNEIDVNKEVLRLNIDDMLRSRQYGVEKINEKYGLNISVSLNEEVYASLLKEAEAVEEDIELDSNTDNNVVSTEEKSKGSENDEKIESSESEADETGDSSTPINSQNETSEPSETNAEVIEINLNANNVIITSTENSQLETPDEDKSSDSSDNSNQNSQSETSEETSKDSQSKEKGGEDDDREEKDT